mmetsp:Transcript_72185/g.218357  ORF Transcript_72185/g.218357 Transcript_72185/m.218357 type:complete len:207 (-) Transcript_72185:128-748(-)
MRWTKGRNLTSLRVQTKQSEVLTGTHDRRLGCLLSEHEQPHNRLCLFQFRTCSAIQTTGWKIQPRNSLQAARQRTTRQLATSTSTLKSFLSCPCRKAAQKNLTAGQKGSLLRRVEGMAAETREATEPTTAAAATTKAAATAAEAAEKMAAAKARPRCRSGMATDAAVDRAPTAILQQRRKQAARVRVPGTPQSSSRCRSDRGLAAV